MAILDVFKVVFQTSGGAQVAKELREIDRAGGDASESIGSATASTDKAKVSLDKATASAKDFSKSLGSGGAGGAAGSAGSAIVAFSLKVAAAIGGFKALKGAFDFGGDVERQSMSLGLKSSSELQKWGKAVEKFGGDRASMFGTLTGIEESRQSLRRGEGGGGLEDAAFTYGLNLLDNKGELKDSFQILNEIARRMGELGNNAERMALGRMSGLDDATSMMLASGGHKGLVAAQTVVSDANAEKLKETADAVRDVWNDAKTMGIDAAASFVRGVEGFGGWVAELVHGSKKTDGIAAAQRMQLAQAAIASAESTPLNSMGNAAGTIGGMTDNSQTTNISIAKVELKTEAGNTEDLMSDITNFAKGLSGTQ